MVDPGRNSMLIDVQYVRANKRLGTPDYLYVVWKDLDSGEKHLNVIPEPEMDIYFEKPEFRNHAYCKNYQHIENLDKKRIKYKDIIYEIANDAGERGQQLVRQAFDTRNYGLLNNLYMYPYVYGGDYDVVSWTRVQWKRFLDNDKPKKLSKGFIDIEADGIEVPGMPSPNDCPINAITIIADNPINNKPTSYTFLYVFRPYNSRITPNPNIPDENKRKEMYENMYKQQTYMMDHQKEFIDSLHKEFDDSFGEIDYKLYFYDDEKKMLVHFWQLINMLKLDIVGIWNISFDMPYIMQRIASFGFDPAEVMCHPDFPVKTCRFKEDKINHDIKNKSDNMFLSSYSIFIDQMQLYASIRKGASELRSYKLNVIAKKELKDSKLDYSEDGDIKTLPYNNFAMFVMYNIKDVLLQYGIEGRTTDFDTLYVSSYQNATPYDKVFRQTVKLRNVQYLSYLNQGLVPGENINIYNNENEEINKIDSDEDDEDSEFEGALVADPEYNGYVGAEMFGRKTNNVFNNAIDFDMSAFYPSSIFAMNIDPSTLIFKVIMPMEQYDLFGGDIPFKGITKHQFTSPSDDGSKECFDNFQTKNFTTTGSKWLNLPEVNEIYDILKKKLG